MFGAREFGSTPRLQCCSVGKLDVPPVRGSVTGHPDGTVLIAGGMDSTGNGLDSAVVCDPKTGKSRLTSTRSRHELGPTLQGSHPLGMRLTRASLEAREESFVALLPRPLHLSRASSKELFPNADGADQGRG